MAKKKRQTLTEQNKLLQKQNKILDERTNVYRSISSYFLGFFAFSGQRSHYKYDNLDLGELFFRQGMFPVDAHGYKYSDITFVEICFILANKSPIKLRMTHHELNQIITKKKTMKYVFEYWFAKNMITDVPRRVFIQTCLESHRCTHVYEFVFTRDSKVNNFFEEQAKTQSARIEVMKIDLDKIEAEVNNFQEKYPSMSISLTKQYWLDKLT